MPPGSGSPYIGDSNSSAVDSGPRVTPGSSAMYTAILRGPSKVVAVVGEEEVDADVRGWLLALVVQSDLDADADDVLAGFADAVHQLMSDDVNPQVEVSGCAQTPRQPPVGPQEHGDGSERDAKRERADQDADESERARAAAVRAVDLEGSGRREADSH